MFHAPRHSSMAMSPIAQLFILTFQRLLIPITFSRSLSLSSYRPFHLHRCCCSCRLSLTSFGPSPAPSPSLLCWSLTNLRPLRTIFRNCTAASRTHDCTTNSLSHCISSISWLKTPRNLRSTDPPFVAVHADTLQHVPHRLALGRPSCRPDILGSGRHYLRRRHSMSRKHPLLFSYVSFSGIESQHQSV